MKLQIIKPFLWISVFSALSLGALKIHVNSRVTLLGYDVGRSKAEESQLLQERGHLKTKLAQLTSADHLRLISQAEPSLESPRVTIAAR